MKCENKLCIFQNCNNCTKDIIEIDYRGNCKNMIFLRITQDALEINKLYSRMKYKADIKDGEITDTEYFQFE